MTKGRHFDASFSISLALKYFHWCLNFLWVFVPIIYLAPQDTRGYSPMDRAALAGRVPVSSEEIAVTPEMVRAGAIILGRYDPRYDSICQTAEEIFQSMLEARVSQLSGDRQPL